MLTFFVITFGAVSQTTLINPITDGGFESGSTFTANGWSESNSANNPWIVGTAVSNGSIAGNSAYITNDAGVSNAYGNTTISNNFFWKDVTVPAGEALIILSFNWVCQGESTWDNWQVFSAPTSITPAATTIYPGNGATNVPAGIAGATFIGNGNLQGTVQTAVFALSPSLAGTTFRLIFSWKNDGSGGTQPPAVIDNVSLTSQVPAPLNGIYTIDNTMATSGTIPASGGNFNSFTAAVTYMNMNGISGPVTFNVTSGQTFAEAPQTITTTGTLANPIIFQKSGAGNPLFLATGGTGTTDAAFAINGADYITFDGININDNPLNTINTTKVEYGYHIKNISATDGAQNNTILNTVITLDRTNTASRGILQSVPTAPSSATGANSNNSYKNLTVKNVYAGIQLTGNTTYPDLNTEVGTTLCTVFNTIGDPSLSNDIGNAGTATYGINATNQSGVKIYNNRIRNVTNTGGQADGITIVTFQGISSVYNNLIQTIKNAGTASTTAISGIRASHNTVGTHSLRIYNNSISEIISGHTGTATATRTLKGIYISGTGGSTTQSYEIYNNNVSINGSSSLNLSSVCFEISTTAGPVYKLGNNIFANYTLAQTGISRHLCIFTTSATTFGPAGSASNNNDLYIANDQGVTGFVGRGNTTDYATLANWQAGITTPAGIDAASISVNPLYTNMTTDLHANSLSLNGAGMAPPAYITTDLDCAARTPDNDIGAYVLSPCAGTPTAGIITGPSSVCSGLGTTLMLTGASADAGITYQWGSSTIAGGPYTNMGTGAMQATGNLTSPMFYIVTLTCSVSGLSSSTAEYNLTINANPVVTVSPTTSTICQPGASPVVLTASNASTYVWGPSTGLSATTGTSVNALSTATTTYTVTGTDLNGCTGTSTASIIVTEIPSITFVTATPSSICSGANSQLLANGATTATYAVTNIPFLPIATPGTGVTTLCDAGTATTTLSSGSLDDGGWMNQTIPFNFQYFGLTYSSFAVSTNGFITLGPGAPTTYTGYNNVFPSAAAARTSLGPVYSDLDFRTIGTINYFVSGTSPNRMVVVNWSNGNFYNNVGAVNAQMIIYETSNVIEMHITNSTGNNNAVEGIQNAAGTTAYTVTGRNNVTWPVSTPDAYRFAPSGGTITYSWSPATFLSSTIIENPVANAMTASTTYTVTVSNGGCSATAGTSITVNPLPSVIATSTANTVCEGTSVTLSGTGTATSYTWDNGVIDAVAFTPTSTATYIVTGTDGNGCSSTASTTVTVNPLPTVAATTTATTVCEGTLVTLSGTGTATSYAWDNGVIDGAAFTPVSTATYIVTGTGANGCTNTASTTVTVNPLPTVTAMTTATAVCTGTSVTLEGMGTATSYTWDNGVIDAVPFTPTSTTTYIVTGIDGNSCSNTASITITVNPLPTVTAVATATAVCAGTSVTLTGTGTSTSYIWDNSVTDGLAFTPTGTATYMVTGTDGNGCENTDMITITVNSLPVVALGIDITQCGGTATLDAGNPGLDYLWTDASTDQTLTVSTTGTYDVTVTDPATGCSGTDAIDVTINAIPVVALGSDMTQCGGTVMLDAGNAGAAYIWNDLSTAQTLTVNASGMYYVAVDNGSCTSNDTINVTINPVPSASMAPFTIPICDNDIAFTLTSGSPAGGVYSGTGVSSGMFDPAVSGAGMFVITYTVTDTNLCSNSDTASITVDLCSGIANTVVFKEISVYPNPANGIVNIAVNNASFSQLTISIIDIQGKEVYNETDKNISAGYNKQINIEKLAKGVYYIKLNTGNDSKVQKLIVH